MLSHRAVLSSSVRLLREAMFLDSTPFLNDTSSAFSEPIASLAKIAYSPVLKFCSVHCIFHALNASFHVFDARTNQDVRRLVDLVDIIRLALTDVNVPDADDMKIEVAQIAIRHLHAVLAKLSSSVESHYSSCDAHTHELARAIDGMMNIVGNVLKQLVDWALSQKKISTDAQSCIGSVFSLLREVLLKTKCVFGNTGLHHLTYNIQQNTHIHEPNPNLNPSHTRRCSQDDKHHRYVRSFVAHVYSAERWPACSSCPSLSDHSTTDWVSRRIRRSAVIGEVFVVTQCCAALQRSPWQPATVSRH